ncbi:helix-turn-helix transcriptional regulator [Halorarius litoreus]|uniref:helix-turn-helix transcriptional regulator n=1 Tax=Halorarius litoreus TaxID=2962676 RepID=UPI0020CFA0AF|nr:helix-turn-helix domain-containing protein [Halorarius litoreus]
MSRSALVGILFALLVATAALSTGLALAESDSAPEALTTQGEFDQTEFRIAVANNGSARWTFRYRQTLQNDSERAEFQTFADEFNENETTLYTDFQSRSQSLVASGQNVTGREMTATDFRKRAYITGLDDNLGVVEMSFRWTGFGVVDGQQVIIGDVFEGGLYIGPSQMLVVTHGEVLTVTDVQPTPDDRSDDTLTYRGERSFADNRPRVVFAPPDGSDGGDGDGGGGGGDGGDGGSPTPPSDGGMGLLPVVALLVVLGLGGGAAYAYRSGAFDGGSTAAARTDDESDDGGSAAAAAPPEPEISDEELLSDDDRVMKMLEERGGRMKQVNIVEETDWSKSKVSMLLSDMEEEGLISKLRVGRENIVSIAGQEPEAAGSPFDDEE